MVIKKYFIALFVFILSSANSFAFPVDAENIPSDKYFEITLKEINNAKSSIQVFMYLISYIPDQPDTLANKLSEALVMASKRGVAVKIVLDQNIDFTEDGSRDDPAYQNKNQAAYEYFKRNNIPVFFDEADTYTHAKVIIIDNETVILGSTNWSKAALTRNNEANNLIKSKEFAQNLLNDLSRIKLQEGPVISTEVIRIPRIFLQDPRLFGEMVNSSDSRAFDIYIYLLKEFNGNKDSKVTLNFDKLSESLGIEKMGNEAYRRQIIKVLGKLKDKYKLIDFPDLKRDKDAEIILKNPKDARKRYELPVSDFFELQTDYFKYGWNKTRSLRAKAFYFINLSKSSKDKPSWFMSREAISKNFHISETFITDGIRELRRQNLLHVQYDSVDSKDFTQRLANVYTPLEFYNPTELEQKIKDLELKHGKDKVDRARKIAQLVYEENSLKTIQAFIGLEDQYGQATLEQAAKIISEKNSDNPKRSAGYFINTVKNIGHSSA